MKTGGDRNRTRELLYAVLKMALTAGEIIDIGVSREACRNSGLGSGAVGSSHCHELAVVETV